MKKFTLLLTLITLTFANPAFAELATKPGDAHISVNGLVCDFCARALEKIFSKEESVSSIDVNLDTKIIKVDFQDGQNLNDARLTKLITDAGYNVESIHRVE